ncbi:MAG: OB-fold nucleic acid binding domain-containing protein [Bacteroidota bacterium]
MQRIVLGVLLAILVGGCNLSAKKEAASQSGEAVEIISTTIEELVSNPAEYEEKMVAITGMVTHVCKHGGQKCFVLGADGETQIRIVPAGDIDEFPMDLEGSSIAIKGTVKVLNPQEAEAHVEDHDSKEHHETEMSHTEAEKAEVFVEAVDFKETAEETTE